MTYTFCNGLFLRVRHHCCWVSNVINKKKLICVNVDDFRTVVVTLTRQKVDFANFCKTSREVRFWHLQRFVHWTFLQTMIVGLCVRNSSYEKKQIDQSLSLSLSDMFSNDDPEFEAERWICIAHRCRWKKRDNWTWYKISFCSRACCLMNTCLLRPHFCDLSYRIGQAADKLSVWCIDVQIILRTIAEKHVVSLFWSSKLCLSFYLQLHSFAYISVFDESVSLIV